MTAEEGAEESAEQLGPLEQLDRLLAAEPRPRRPWALLLLLLPILAVIYPPLYNDDKPAVGGIPFFVWYQMLAVVFGGAITGLVYLLRRRDGS